MSRHILCLGLSVLVLTGLRAAGEPCSDDTECGPAPEYCLLPLGVCSTMQQLGTCYDPSGRTCTDVEDFHCGCDLRTYSNRCWAEVFGRVSVLHAGECEPCETDPCGSGTFCKLPLGDCRNAAGVCLSSPVTCPATCELVCGCDRVTYSNECEADLVGAQISYYGPCVDSRDTLILGVKFLDEVVMDWLSESGASSYNVYRKVVSGLPPSDAGSCLLADVATSSTPIADVPMLPNELWFLQVNGNFDQGEGPLGLATDCTPRSPLASCH